MESVNKNRVSNRWITGVVGVWILISPWLLGFADISIMKWSNLICGSAIILISVWEIFGERSFAPGEKQS